MVDIKRMEPCDVRDIDLQPSQRRTLGLEPHILSMEEAAALAAGNEAYSLWDGSELIACVGIHENFPGVQGIAYAYLSGNIGSRHLALTRFVRRRVAASKLRRIEAIVRANDAEEILQFCPDLDAEQLLAAVMVAPTPECVWAQLVGLRPAHVLRKFGAASETHILFERVI